jgi:uncharacterized repeat protein (TIGR01451 family)
MTHSLASATAHLVALIALVVGGLSLTSPDASAQSLDDICKSIPGGANNVPFLYVFGPKGADREGREDSAQVIFYRIPAASTKEVTLYVFDPASGNKVDPKPWPLRDGLPTMTTISVYGGSGAFSDPKSRGARPTRDQAGELLDSQSFSAYSEETWASFGPFTLDQGEQVGEYIYFKLVAHAPEGAERNFFRCAVCPYEVESFTYNVTVHLAKQFGETMAFDFEVPAYTKQLVEHNYDVDDGGRVAIMDGQVRLKDLKTSTSGKWIENELEIAPAEEDRNFAYTIVKSYQEYANAAFYITDGDGTPLKIFLHSNAIPTPQLPGPSNECRVATELVNMRKHMPFDVAIDEEFEVAIDLTTLQDTQTVFVQDDIPKNIGFIRSDPPADVFKQRLVWRFDDMRAGDSKHITVTLRALYEGDVAGCAWVNVTPEGSLVTKVGSAVLNVTKNAPVRVRLGDKILYNMVVENTGSVAARNVELTEIVPRALDHPSGQRTFKYAVGDLQPNESKTFKSFFRTREVGKICSRVVATADFTEQAMDEACTLVEKEVLDLSISGPETLLVGKRAEYSITVTNGGETTLTNVAIAQATPRDAVLLDALGGMVRDNFATWMLPSLAPGETKDFDFSLVSRVVGKHCSAATAACAEGLETSAETCTDWTGYSAISIEVIDTIDPLIVGEETQYIIQVRNQGSAPESDVIIRADFPKEITPLGTQGATIGDIAGKTVTFRPYVSLAGDEMIQFTINAKAERAGDGRLSIRLSTSVIDPPLIEEEATQVY